MQPTNKRTCYWVIALKKNFAIRCTSDNKVICQTTRSDETSLSDDNLVIRWGCPWFREFAIGAGPRYFVPFRGARNWMRRCWVTSLLEVPVLLLFTADILNIWKSFYFLLLKSFKLLPTRLLGLHQVCSQLKANAIIVYLDWNLTFGWPHQNLTTVAICTGDTVSYLTRL
jgi:hypothetical protein